MKKINLKRILKIIAITAIVVYFCTNTLINIIGVPLAAYHSYQSWQEVQAGQPVSHEDFHVKEEEKEETQKDTIQVKKEENN